MNEGRKEGMICGREPEEERRERHSGQRDGLSKGLLYTGSYKQCIDTGAE